jgi:hypothetical protein
MTSLEALETYSCHHSETFDELLEWPYRRFIKAFSAFQRRKAVDEIENRKSLHIQAYQQITEWKEEGDQQKAIEDVERYYELLKDYTWDSEKSQKENQEMRDIEESDDFLKAGKRNLAKVLSPLLPNQEKIEKILDE